MGGGVLLNTIRCPNNHNASSTIDHEGYIYLMNLNSVGLTRELHLDRIVSLANSRSTCIESKGRMDIQLLKHQCRKGSWFAALVGAAASRQCMISPTPRILRKI